VIFYVVSPNLDPSHNVSQNLLCISICLYTIITMDEVALNELVYVRGIGYGTLVDCPNSKTIPRLKSSESAQSSEQMVPLFE
jgi:hypothetical protein